MFHLAITRRHLLQSGASPPSPRAWELRPALPRLIRPPRNPERRAGLAARAVTIRRRQIPGRFQTLRLRQSGRPKGGVARQILIGTFDNFNLAVAGVKGSLASAVALVYESLTTPSLDEVSTEYGALAESVSHPEDFSSVVYRLRAQAKWHDGKPVTPEDVIFSLEAFKKYHPQYSAYYRHVVKAEKAGERDIKVHLRCAGQSRTSANRRAVDGAAEALVGRRRQRGRKRDISATTLEKPLGSGHYRVREFVPGRSIALERVKDYWGRDLNVNRAQ
jgi:ABC-type dipeptide transport system, periplasmic component